MKYVYVIAAFLLFTISLVAQEQPLDLKQKMPTDPNIVIGTFDNGLRYYIRENTRPENRAELRLVVNAGSVLEDDDQRGLAHFIEHMAFNGTKNYEKQEIVDYLETIGMRFGPDINAYTSFDETVYMLQLPTDDLDIVTKGFHILEEWASNIAFDDKEIEKERGVVVEEWRLGRGADARMRDKQFPVLFHESRYAERLPIGKKNTLETAPPEVFHRFYRDWYRPDLMAVIAIGDFDKAWIHGIIEEHFAKLKNPSPVRRRELFPVPNHEQTLFSIASDKEATQTTVSVYYKHDIREEETIGAYRRLILETLYQSMFNNRLDELLQNPNPPFIYGYSSEGRMIRSKEFYFLGAAVKETGVLDGLETLLTEAARVKQHGFTASELERTKVELLRGMEKAYNERGKTESFRYAAEYIRNFLADEPVPGIEFEYAMYKMMLPGMGLQEINQLADQWIRDESRVVLVDGPEKEDTPLPSQTALTALLADVGQKRVTAYVDQVTDEPLLESQPVPGTVTAENVFEEIDVTEWTLSNGIKVVLKQTDFKNDELLFTSYSPGGHSLIKDTNYIPAATAASIIRQGGLANFDQIALQKKLSGKLVNVSPWINSLDEGLSGSASPQDMQTMFKLIHLYFKAPRKDSTAFLSYYTRYKDFIKNRGLSPQAAYQDTLQVTMSNYHYRTRPWSESILDEMDLEQSFQIYKDRFADASDFTFFFVGNFEMDSMRPLVTTYLASLPALNRNEAWRDVGIRSPHGVIQKIVRKGVEPQSRVSIIFSGDYTWERQNNYRIQSMAQAFQIKLREILREDLGGTYSIRASAMVSRYPNEEYNLNIAFGCSPERVQELTETVFQQIDSLRNHGLDATYLQKVKEAQLRKRETDLKENRFWLNGLRTIYYHGRAPETLMDYDKLVESLTIADIQTAAKTYFVLKNYVKVVLQPEKGATGSN